MIEQASKAKEEKESMKMVRKMERENWNSGLTDEEIAHRMQEKEINRLRAQEEKENRREERRNRE